MCHDCHKIIDDVDHRQFFPPDKLRDIKDSFERRIEMVTDHGGLTRTAALRVGGLIRGSLALASQREVAETLLAADYLGLVETRRSGDFTCRIPGAAGGKGFWDSGCQAIDDTLDLVHQAIDCGDVEHVSVFAIAPIPLLVYLGWNLDDKTPTRIFQKHRDLHQGWSWSTATEPVQFGVSVLDHEPLPDSGDRGRDVVLTCGVSSPIDPDLLPAELAGLPRIDVGPSTMAPGPTLITHEESLKNFASIWRGALATVEARFPKAQRWHLVASAPVTIAVETGRSFMRDAHPPVAVYERLPDSSYEAVLTVNNGRHG
jgi:hypothetical protein